MRTKDRDSVKTYPKGDSPVFDYLHRGKLLNESDVCNYTILRVLNDLEILKSEINNTDRQKGEYHLGGCLSYQGKIPLA